MEKQLQTVCCVLSVSRCTTWAICVCCVHVWMCTVNVLGLPCYRYNYTHNTIHTTRSASKAAAYSPSSSHLPQWQATTCTISLNWFWFATINMPTFMILKKNWQKMQKFAKEADGMVEGGWWWWKVLILEFLVVGLIWCWWWWWWW